MSLTSAIEPPVAVPAFDIKISIPPNLDEIKLITSKYLNEKNLKTGFLKPIYGDASGVRGAALLGRQNLI